MKENPCSGEVYVIDKTKTSSINSYPKLISIENQRFLTVCCVYDRKYGIQIKDFGKSWRDGLAFNAIVHTIRPDLIDFENVRNQTARVNLEQAFSTAEDHLGIPRLLDPEGKM